MREKGGGGNTLQQVSSLVNVGTLTAHQSALLMRHSVYLFSYWTRMRRPPPVLVGV